MYVIIKNVPYFADFENSKIYPVALVDGEINVSFTNGKSMKDDIDGVFNLDDIKARVGTLKFAKEKEN